jgi:DNA topoisomerase-1
MRLRRSDPASPGHGRRRHGNGFSYSGHDGRPLPAPEVLRCRELAIPPAWTEVWICADPAGHLQATGVDAAGRRQYLYQPQWRARRDRHKFDHVLEVGRRLPRLRPRIRTDLARPGLERDKVLALAARLLDRGLFRVGSDPYAKAKDPTFGVATLQARHVRLGAGVTICYAAKGGIERTVAIYDRTVVAVIADLRRSRRGRSRLLAYRSDAGTWCEVHAADINDYLRVATGLDMTAKDLRTWHGSLHAAVALARADPPTSAPAGCRRGHARGRREPRQHPGRGTGILCGPTTGRPVSQRRDACASCGAPRPRPGGGEGAARVARG